MPVFVYPILIPIEIMGMFVRPFALMARLAANMTGGHIAHAGDHVVRVHLCAAVRRGGGRRRRGRCSRCRWRSASWHSKIIVVLVQAYVFTLLTAVFIGMAIHAHH